MQKKTWLFWLLATILLLPSAGVAQQTLRWEATLDDAQRLAGQTNRLVLIHFWATWCGSCKLMESEVLSQPPVVAELSADYVIVKVDADQLPATARHYGITALPTTVITTPQGQVLDSMLGRVEAAEYLARLNQVAAGAKQRRSAIYAQVPAGRIPPAAAAPTTVPMSPAAGPSPMAGSQPPSLGGPSLNAGTQPPNIAGPLLNTSTRPPVGGSQPAGGDPSLSDDRYADFFRRSQASPATPIPQPSSALPGPANVPPPTNYVPPGNPSLPSPTASRSPQFPTINQPLGLSGYCPVSLAEKQQWVLGDRRWGAVHRGQTYLFVGPEQQRRFFTDPDRYAPVISGNDVVLATEEGQPVPGMREHGVFFGNRVYLFSSEATLEKFARNPSLYVNQAMGAVRSGAYAGRPLQ